MRFRSSCAMADNLNPYGPSPTQDEREQFMQEAAGRVAVDDEIELRHDRAPMLIDSGEAHEPDYRWEVVTVLALATAPAGNIVAEVRHKDGQTSIRPLIFPIWRPRTS